MAAFEQDFEGYNTGQTLTQNGWTTTLNDDTSLVEETVKHSGSKAIIFTGNTKNNLVEKSFSGSADSIQDFWLYEDTNGSAFSVRVYAGTGQLFVLIGYEDANGGKLLLWRDGYGSNEDLGAVPSKVWFKVSVQWRSSDHYTRARVNDGTWTNWGLPLTAWSGSPTKIDLNINRGTSVWYIDDFATGSETIPSSPSIESDLIIYN